MSLGCAELDQHVANWLKLDKNEKDRKEVQELVAKKDIGTLKSRMCAKMAFGTAGIRSRMEAGFNRLNDLTILMLTNGFALHLKEVYKRESNGVAIGYDGRYNSRRWAELAANVFVQNGIKVYLFSEVCPTPVTSYATIKLKCDAGLMITASHNPKHDNGYKAYWTNGAQILAPHDTEICRIAYANMEPKPEYWDLSKLQSHPLLHSADPIIDDYFVDEQSLCHYKSINMKCPIKFTYSAFHGVGLPYAMRLFENFGFSRENISIVEEQAKPDPAFPTVPFPNPEEGRPVLKLSIETADKNGASIILANDPDADRFQLAEKQSDGEWKIFAGNEMGALISWWAWMCWCKENPKGDASNVYILNSAVSSSIVKTMAAKEGFKHEQTLTGFKWMGNKADELRKAGKNVILAWEESIGFMAGHPLDKDGITAAGVFAEMASYLNSQNLTLSKQLFNIYKQYGFHLVRSSYWFVPNPEVTKKLFAKLRKDNKYPTKIGNHDVKYVRDLTTGYDNEQPGNKPILPISTSSDMITFTLASGSLATVRASGTEPKVKYYIELKTAPGKEEKDLTDVVMELSKLEEVVVASLLEPDINGLIARK
uniref:Phosphoglucomutase-2 n=1 Tax=Ascaris suum TaxID=6253 RepID=F1KTP4_ASCSU